MATTIDFCKCPKCNTKYEFGFKNRWLGSLFGEYALSEATHTCENCGSTFVVTAKKQIKMTTKLVK